MSLESVKQLLEEGELSERSRQSLERAHELLAKPREQRATRDPLQEDALLRWHRMMPKEPPPRPRQPTYAERRALAERRAELMEPPPRPAMRRTVDQWAVRELGMLRVCQWLQTKGCTLREPGEPEFMEASPERCAVVAYKHTPADVLIKFCREDGGGGLAWVDGKRQIEVPKPISIAALAIYLHELGHIALGHRNGPETPLRHVEETESELFALRILREEKIPILQSELARAARNVRFAIAEDRKLGHAIDPIALKFAEAM
jgi:hypothetical protein